MFKTVLKIAAIIALFGAPVIADEKPFPDFYHNPTFSGQMIEIGNGNGASQGGSVKRYFRMYSDAVSDGDGFQITAAECVSACTFFLRAPFTCVSSKTTFKFHVPSKYMFFKPDNADEINEALAQWYDLTGNGDLGEWFRSVMHDTGSMKFAKLKGSQLIAEFGIKECK